MEANARSYNDDTEMKNNKYFLYLLFTLRVYISSEGDRHAHVFLGSV